MNRFFFVAIGLCASSCGVYKSGFDCPPGKGIGCASISEVMDLIVERENGDDLFIQDRGAVLLLKQQVAIEKKVEKKRGKLRLVKQSSGELALQEGEEKP